MADMQSVAYFITSGWAALVVVAGVIVWLWSRGRKKFRKWDTAIDTLVGRPEIRDSVSGEVLAEAMPPLGVRLAKMDKNMEAMQLAIIHLAEANARALELNDRMDVLEKKVDAHIDECRPKNLVGFAVSTSAEVSGQKKAH